MLSDEEIKEIKCDFAIPLYADEAYEYARAIERAVLAKASKQEPVCEVVQINQDRYFSLTCVGAAKPKIGDKLYFHPAPPQAAAMPEGWRLYMHEFGHIQLEQIASDGTRSWSAGFSKSDDTLSFYLHLFFTAMLSAAPKPEGE
jgi:hypothetical protein